MLYSSEKMTGPGPGKILINAEIILASKTRKFPINCQTYIHLKGYSNARVTHIDIECPSINNIIKPNISMYGILNITKDNLEIVLFKPIIMKKPALVIRKIIICSQELINKLKGKSREIVYIGGKEGGIFLGFKKDIIEILEKEYFPLLNK